MAKNKVWARIEGKTVAISNEDAIFPISKLKPKQTTIVKSKVIEKILKK